MKLQFGNLEHILKNQQSILLQILLDSPKLRKLLDIFNSSEDDAIILILGTNDNQTAIDILSFDFDISIKEIVEYIDRVSSSELRQRSKLTDNEFFLLTKVYKQNCYVSNLLVELESLEEQNGD